MHVYFGDVNLHFVNDIHFSTCFSMVESCACVVVLSDACHNCVFITHKSVTS